MYNLSEEEFEEFARRFPAALAFLLGKNLRREYSILRQELAGIIELERQRKEVHLGRKRWIESRLQELELARPDLKEEKRNG